MKKAQNNIEKIYPLTPMQEGMLFHTIRDKNLEAYFIQLSYSVSGKIDLEIFSESIDILSKRHDIFRTAFAYESTERPIQVVLRNRKIALRILDKTTLHPNDYKSFIETFKDADVKKGFDLVKEPLVRLSIIKKEDDSYDFLWSFHHIIVDGWCNTIIVEELNEIYASLLQNRKITLPEPILYSTYIKWLEAKNTASTAKYWNTYLQDYNHIAEIPKLTNTTTNFDLRNAVEKSTLSKKTTTKLATIAKNNTVTLNDIFQTFWGLILAKYSGSNDVVYGNVVSGRPPELHGMDRCLGLFMNTIPVRIHFKDEEALLDITKRVHNDFLEGTPYHYGSLVEIQNATPLKSNLIKHIIAFENYPIAQEDEEDRLFEISNVNTFERTNYNFDLDVELGEEIQISFFYHPETYHPELIKRVKNSFETLIHQFVENPNEKIKNISFISKEDENELLYNFNNEAVDLKNNQPINVLFEEEVHQKSERIAVIHNTVQWTYEKLNIRANQIANTLLKNGLQKGYFVGLHIERSPELVAAMLGIFKAGGIYVPMDTQNPATRTLELLKDGEIKALISDKEHLLALKNGNLLDNSLKQIICLDNTITTEELNIETIKVTLSSEHNILKNEITNPKNNNQQTDWAYMLYTSGSTGKPKGAITRHDGALNHILAEYKALNLKDGFSFLQSASIASDISVWQILAPLLKGGKVVIVDKDDVLDYQKTLHLMKEHDITIAEFVPSYLIGFVELVLELNPQENILPSLEWMMMVGEEIPVRLVNDWLQLFPECKVLNGYGPCEASDDITQFEITKPLPLNTPKVSIGKPIDNMNIFVLDNNEKLVPIGVAGEICVAGIGVGAGYFKDPEKTAKSFKPNPFPNTLGDTMYKTGDLGRWLPDGNLEFLGRKDRQLKIRGNRVELGEIEALIRDSQLVENVAVVAHKKSPSDTPLIAFVIQKTKEETAFANKTVQENLIHDNNSDTLYATRITKKESLALEKLLIEKCTKGLPSYMQPNEYIFVDKIPQNLSDKVDEKKLLTLYRAQISEDAKTLIEVEECITTTEKTLKAIWEKILQRKPIGASDDFFEKGGHSLLAMRVKSAIQKQMKIQLDIKDLFVYTKLKELAAHIDQEPISKETNEITIQQRPNRIPLSYAQERLWFIDTLKGSTEYNVSSILQLKGNLNNTLLENCLREIVNRHETLRCLIKEDTKIPYLEFLSSKNWKLNVKELTNEADLNEVIEKLTAQPFNLAEDFKLRAHIIQQQSGVNMLVLVMHHIASDGWSESILVDELLELYDAGINNKTPKLTLLKIQYTDYILWQQKNKHTLDNQANYWKKQLANVSKLNIPTDYVNTITQSNDGDSIITTINENLLGKIKELSTKNGTTLYTMLLAAFKILLHKYTGQEDIAIGTPVAGRTNQEIEHLIGFFVNILVVRSEVKSEINFTTFLAEVKNTSLNAYSNQDIPFEKVVEVATKQRDLSDRNPLYQVLFNFQNTPKVQEIVLGDLEVDFVEPTNLKVKADLHFIVAEHPEGKGLLLEVEYPITSFKKSTIERLVSHYVELLNSIVENPMLPIGRLGILNTDETIQLHYDFNNTTLPYYKEKSVVTVFKEQVVKTPQDIALTFGADIMTYKELDKQSDKVAAYLQSKNVTQGTHIGILFNRGFDMIVSMIGVLKAGAAYVPLDPSLPLNRLSFIIEDSDITNILYKDETLKSVNNQYLSIDKLLTTKETYAPVNRTINSTAYIMYTSGTTGTPKGILITDENILTLVYDKDAIQIKQTDRVLQWSNYAFDGCTYEIFGSLLSGASLYLIPTSSASNIADLSSIVKKEKLTVAFLTTALFNSFVDYDLSSLNSLRILLFGGEQVSVNHVERAFEALGADVLIHVYGPTETTTYATFYPIINIPKQANTIPIGKPLANTQLYVLDTQQQLVPIGVTGELYIGGTGVAKGYLNREELTTERFIKSPFKAEDRLYRTGDLVRWSEEGNIEFIGRTDSQVKISGYRIELGEIETVLFNDPSILSCCVLVKQDNTQNKRLVCYIVGNTNFNKEKLQSSLQEKLPNYMIPGIWVLLDEMPLNANGKIDRKALPEPDMNVLSSSEYVGPRNAVEEKLVQIWQELLSIDNIGIHDNFFEIGGHSILATRVISLIRKELVMEVPVKLMFTQPTIARFASQLSEFSKNTLIPEIIPQDKPDFTPLSYSQQGLWFIDKLQGSSEYHIPIAVKLAGDVNPQLLEKSLRTIVERHEVLRTVIKEQMGIGYQELINSNNWKLSEVTIENDSLENEIITKFTNIAFDLSKDYMLRACLYKLPDNTYVLVCVFHHIASDGWSLSIFTDEFTEIYDTLYAGKELKLPKLSIQYADYAIWQRKYISEAFLDVQLSYWERKLKGTTPIPLATDFARPAIQSTVGATVYLELDNVLKQKLNQLCLQEGVTLFMLLLAGLKVVLSKYSGQSDICIGTPVANRNTSDVEQIIGCFINTIALRSQVDQSLSFTEFLQEVKETTLEGYHNGQAPFDKVVEQVIEERDMSITPIFQIMFGLQNTPALRETGLEVLKVSSYDLEEGTTQFDLNISANEHENGISLSIEYCTNIFKEETVQKLFAHYKELLTNITLNETETIASLAILTSEEQEQLLYNFNDTDVDYNLSFTVIDLFEQQVKMNPDRVALSFEGTTKTYAALDKQSNQLAHYLIQQGVKANNLVGICLERSFDMVVGILGILKAGGAYVPIKPDYPTSRIHHILEDTNCSILITDIASKYVIDTTSIDNIETIELDSEYAVYHNKPTTSLTNLIHPDTLSYVIYTSGSTGTPKGALIEHKGLLNHLLVMNDTLELNENTTVAFTAPFTFDISVWQILSSLLVGGKTAIYKENDLLDTTKFVENLNNDTVTILQLVPSYTVSLLETTKAGQLNTLNYFLVTGEAVTIDVLDKWFQAYPNVPVVNAYGPAEASDDVTLHIMTESPKHGLVSIGKPVANMQIYIVNTHENLCPVGIIGELWVGGVGVGKGYLNLEQLTKERFITNPFTGKGKVYKTGDLGRWLSDGTIEFVGRIDDQVKIRGHRIELGEIESTLSSIKTVLSCCVLAKDDENGIKNLVGYIVTDGTTNNDALQEKLLLKLPDYMVPRLWVILDEMPLTPNGKINKKELPEPGTIEISSEKYTAPKTDIELQLVGIWQELLGINKIGTQDNFFELGGHSLVATQLVARIRQHFNLEEFSVVDIFTKPILEDLATAITCKKPKDKATVTIQKIESQQDYELSHAQKRMWILNKLEENQTNYNIPYALQLIGKLNIDVLNKAIQAVVNKYEILRTIFITIEGDPRQKIVANYQYTPIYRDISNDKDRSQIAKTAAEKQANIVFNLDEKPPFAIQLLKLEEERFVFLFNLHHIISDGWSAQVLLDGILQQYKSIIETGKSEETKLDIQYKDYSVWQHNILNQKGIDTTKQYWNDKFSTEITPLNLPFDKPNANEDISNGASQKATLSKESYNAVKQFAKQNDVTLFTVLMSLFKTLLHRYSDQNDIVVGTPVNGRDHVELEDQIGFFVNTLAIRSNIQENVTFNNVLNEVKSNLLDGYKHQMYPFDKLVNDLNIPLEGNKNPIFDVLVDFQSDDEINEIKNDYFKIEEFEQDLNFVKFDLFFSFTEEDGSITIIADYKTLLFSDKVIERMLTHLKLITDHFIANPNEKVNNFDYLSKEETLLLEDLNSTTLPYSKEKSVVTVFKEQAVKTPQDIALTFGTDTMTYEVLDQQSDKVAAYLQSKNTIKGTHIGILFNRGFDMIVSMVGILKAGCAYVPLDPSLPLNRLSFIIEDASITTIIYKDQTLKSMLEIVENKYISIDELLITKEIYLPITRNITSVAYIMYTSGTTGIPKGILINDENILSLIYDNSAIQIKSDDRVLQWSNYAFDGSTYEIFGSLLCGASLYLINNSSASDVTDLSEIVKREQITATFLTVALFNSFVDYDLSALQSFRILVFGGDKASFNHVKKAFEYLGSNILINGYGPTETTTFAITHTVKTISEKDYTIPIGKPLSNTKAYVLDTNKNTVPIGITGELHIGGSGVAEGYLNRDELTAEKFITSPFNKENILYVTGDLVRWLEDGTIEFIGRADKQVKIRGYRIELGEIEAVLFNYKGVSNCSILTKKDVNDNKNLVAYVVLENELDKQHIQDFLRDRLPDYMIPRIWVRLDSMPLTSNGKIDKKNLPEPNMSDISLTKYVAPTNETEKKLTKIWEQLLGINKIGIHDNFFEIGGHSILATRVISLIRKELVIEVPVKLIFAQPTIARFVSQLGKFSKNTILPEIVSQDKPDFTPLSYSQQGLWFIDKLQGSSEYHIPIAVKLAGDVNPQLLEKSLRTIVERHEILRTVIKEQEGIGYQELINSNNWKLSEVTIENDSLENEIITKFTNIAFDLSKDYMLRASLYKLPDNTYVLVCVFHHIASDGWSLSIFTDEFTEIYDTLYAGKELKLPKLSIQYADYAIWQRKYISEAFLDVQLSYWERKLKDTTPIPLATDFARPAIQSTAGATVYLELDNVLKQKLNQLCLQEGVTLFMLLLAGLKVVLSKYSGQSDICIGTPVANRNTSDVEQIIGYFVNTIALRTEVDQSLSFTEFLQEVKETTLEGYHNGQAPFDKVVEQVIEERDMSITPIFQIMFSLQNTPALRETGLEVLTISPYELEEGTTQFDLNISANEHENGISLNMEYCTDLFKEETVQKMFAHYKELLTNITLNETETIASLAILTSEEQEQLLYNFNNTNVAYDLDLTIVDLFEQQVKKNPNAVAIVYENEHLTYSELNKKSNQLAHYLVEKGVKPDNLVGICLDRSLDMVVGILGILKAGGAYVPIDPDYPTSRINYIVEDSQINILVSTTELQSVVDLTSKMRTVLMDTDWNEIAKKSIKNIVDLCKSSQLAYVIYTSGSTGNPKGVLLTHLNVARLFKHDDCLFDFNENDVWTMFHSFCFDFSVWELYGALFHGGRLILVPKETTKDLAAFKNLINKEKVTVLNQTPGSFYVLQDELLKIDTENSLRYVIFGGEALNPSKLSQWKSRQPNCKLINMYGITETTVHVTYKELTIHDIESTLSNIGAAIPTLTTYILDDNLQLLPIGIVGELCISGSGLARGYLNREELTNEKFIPSPFITGERLYRSGDLGRWLPNGDIEFIGRKDDQVKIRGYRIELGEIESQLSKLKEVKNCCVLAKPDSEGIKSLVAYIVLENELNKEKLQNDLKLSLPEYMVPQLWVPLENLPLTSNGKIAKQLLPNPSKSGLSTKLYKAPNTTTEELLAQVWQDLLKVKQVGIHDNFFELGGHSLIGIRLLSKIEQKFNKKLALKEVFIHPTLEELAIKLDEQQETIYKPIEAVAIRTSYPVSHAQKRLWLLHEFSDNKIAYNLPSIYWLKGNLNIDALSKALLSIIKKHEILRTIFKEIHGEPQQIIIPIDEFKAPITLEKLTVSENEIETFIATLVNKPFNLSEGPLLDVRVYEKDTNSNLLVLNFHHIISDGWSTTIFLNELCNYYNSFVNKEKVVIDKLPIQYKDYAVWEGEQFTNGMFEKDKAYWKKNLAGELTRFSLPQTYKNTKATNIGKTIRYAIDDELLQKLEALTIQLNVSLYMLLLGTFKALAYRYTGINDIIVGTVVAGREKEELSNQIGFYVNTIAQRTFINGNASFKELLLGLRDNLLEIEEHQYYPFDKVVSDLELPKSEQESPLFDILFVHQNTEDLDDSVKMSGLETESVDGDLIESKFDASFVTKKMKDGLEVFIEYNAVIYSEDFLNQYLHHFEALLRTIEKNIDSSIDQLKYLTSEDQFTLASFNQTKTPKIDATMHQIVEQRAIETPNKKAIIFNDVVLTYEALNAKANALAYFIKGKYNPQKDTFIAFSMERSEWQIITMLAILKVGAAFLPIDAKQPNQRKKLILQDANPILIIADDTLDIKELDSNLERLNNIKELLPKYATENLKEVIHPNSIAYVIYTSGSTGIPKGVMIPHKGNINMVSDQIKQLTITPNDICLQFASISFDASIYEIFISLHTGSSLVLVTDETIANPIQFVNYITKHKVSFATLPPAYLSGLDKEKLKTLKTIVTAGESPNYSDAIYFSKKLNYFNAYGPTEYSVCATLYKVKGDENSIPIGKPIGNTEILILDESMNSLPIGCWGELYLAGEGIAKGYINKPEKNKEAFLTHPFKPDNKLYKTGDIGRWLSDGNIEFSTRTGDIIKIRGYRVEKGEICTAIEQYKGIKEVILSFDTTQQLLTAFVVSNQSIDTLKIKNYLRNLLPEYMIPNFIIAIDKVPLTTNGKVAYKQLKKITNITKETISDAIITPPENELEEKIIELWKAILGDDIVIGTSDNFFEIGGQSITAMKLISALWNSFQKEIKLKDVLLSPTVKGLANLLNDDENKDTSLAISLNEVNHYKVKLFMVPPVIGTPLLYRPLAQKLTPNKIACIGLQYSGFEANETLNSSIEEMAKNMFSDMLDHLDKTCENIVLGYSMGALLAVEIVALIEAQGYKTKLVLIDKDRTNDTGIYNDEAFDTIINEQLDGFGVPEFSRNRVHHLIHNNIAILKTYTGYKGILNSDILAIEAKESDGSSTKMKSWKKITNSNFKHTSVKGDHFSILENENLNEVFNIITKFINNN